MSKASNINVVPAPDGYTGQGFFATKFDYVIGLARANSLWPLPFATSCCGIEFMATMASTYDLEPSVTAFLHARQTCYW